MKYPSSSAKNPENNIKGNTNNGINPLAVLASLNIEPKKIPTLYPANPKHIRAPANYIKDSNSGFKPII